MPVYTKNKKTGRVLKGSSEISRIYKGSGIVYNKEVFEGEEICMIIADLSVSHHVEFSASRKFSDTNLYIDWGDGITERVTQDSQFSHTYADDITDYVQISLFGDRQDMADIWANKPEITGFVGNNKLIHSIILGEGNILAVNFGSLNTRFLTISNVNEFYLFSSGWGDIDDLEMYNVTFGEDTYLDLPNITYSSSRLTLDKINKLTGANVSGFDFYKLVFTNCIGFKELNVTGCSRLSLINLFGSTIETNTTYFQSLVDTLPTRTDTFGNIFVSPAWHTTLNNKFGTQLRNKKWLLQYNPL